MIRASLLVLTLLCASASPAGGGDNPFVEKYLATAERLRSEGKLERAKNALARALERDRQHLGALRAMAELAREMGDTDLAVYSYHRWMSVVEGAEEPQVSGRVRRDLREALELLDPEARSFRSLTEDYVESLLDLAGDHLKRGRFHSALEVYHEVLHINPLNRAARDGAQKVRRTGGNDIAVDDIFAGGDPNLGVDPEWISEEDAKHAEWDNAWEKDGENYRYKTNAGFVVLQTSSIAMEQMNRFYRKFFRYKEDGGATPKIEVRIFKNRDEYLELGSSPAEWSGGQFTGSAVETYVGGVTGEESIRQMYGTLFHEAAHQFVSLTGKGGVPGWLNEAYASFFEGCTILSNGQVKWNQVPQHRLFPLAARMEKGWMNGPDDGVRDAAGEWATPERAPDFRTVVEGRYTWGPPWYAPTWGVVYFLYNYRDEEGTPVFRDSLHEYYLSSARGRPDPAAHFEEIVLAAPGSPVSTIDELSAIWRDWIIDLREVQIGNKEAGKSNLDYGDAAAERGDLEAAVEFYEEAYTHYREDPDVLWKLAQALEEQGNQDRAAALYREFARELDMRGIEGDPRHAQAVEKMEELDPLNRRHARLKERLEEDGLALAQSYLDRRMPRMAMEIARQMSASYSMPGATEFYVKVALESGMSLASWKVAYNEYDLEGWSGGEGYRAYGRMIQADVRGDADVVAARGSFQTKELVYDVPFEADFSIETELRYASQDATLLGVCFGRKDDQNTHAVVLHPAGYLDISTKQGGLWSVRDHRAVMIDDDWQKLRVDVVDNAVDVYLNDRYVRSMKMPSRDSLRGGFGLITGEGGACEYRNIRVLARDPYDPAARIERAIALERLGEDDSLREPGTFTGFEPAPLQLNEWIQGDPIDLTDLGGRPTVLIFWAPYQEEQIPTLDYYNWLVEQYEDLGIEWVVVVSGQHRRAEFEEYLETRPLRGMRIARDNRFQTYDAYNLKAGGWGLPRILIIDVDGKVRWEGDPGLKIGIGWDPQGGETYLDGALKALVEERHLLELRPLRGRLAEARRAHEEGEIRQALNLLAPLADLDADHDREVQGARALRDRIEQLGAGLPAHAAELLEQGRPLQAEAVLESCAEQFAGTPSGDLADARLADLQRDRRHKSAKRAWRELADATRLAAEGASAREVRAQIQEAVAARNDIAEIEVVYDAMLEALESEGVAAVSAVWEAHQPGFSLDEFR